MRTSSIVLVLVALIVMCGFAPATSAQTPSNTQFEAAGTDAVRVQAFLATLQGALAIENHLKVASLVKYPLDAWADGQTLTIRNDSDLLAHYRQIFDSSLRRSIAEARMESLAVSADGVVLDGGRLCFKAGDKGRALKIVKIGEPVGTR
ncbi:MAG: hypothetical protein NT151_05515 [Acidobacteria bacterium]|nr:hypothetical protein [Acidobacteriota bacterium]